MLLGDIFANLQKENVAAETILRVGDLALLAELRERAAENNVTLGYYARWAFRTYADNAPPDECTTLIGLLDRADDPGAVCLNRALGYVLACVEPSGNAAS